MSASLAAFTRPRNGATNTVFKSGPLFISSKGLGWKSWKKRWFILTRTSLVFFKNDPSALSQRGSEVNLTLGGIDLNNSGSVVVREDKKLLTVLFPDGRDGRAFTLKAETPEDLYEWKTALEHALVQAPNAALVMGHNGIFRNDTTESIEGSFHQWRDKRPIKSLVVGRPILLALEDIDGGPSFLEKALRFLEKHGSKVEGILRQSADVEEVDRRVQEYETGKTEFSSDEDAHVVGDCVKHVLRELPSSPVPASCCTALLEAYKIDRKEARVNAMRAAILETFPEPNRRLLQRILKMMHTVSMHTSENRMTASAVAACMAPLLLRPLLAGECELEDDFDDNPDSRDNSASEDSTDDENMEIKDNVYHDAENEADQETDEDPERIFSGKLSESSGYDGSDLYDFKMQQYRESENQMDTPGMLPECHRSTGVLLSSIEQGVPQSFSGHESCTETPISKLTGSNYNGRKTPSMESIDSSGEEEVAVQRLELTKNDLRQRIAKEARGNVILQASLERRKQALHERRLALEQDVQRLQEQLQAERDLRAALEVGLSMSSGQVLGSRNMDSKTRAELEEIALAEADVAQLKQKVAELHQQLHQQRQHHYDASDRHLHLQLRNLKGQALMNGRQLPRKHFLDSTSLSDSKSTGASTSLTTDDFGAERRSQLMEQLHNLDLNYSTSSQDFTYKQPSPGPGWNILKRS
ncbi:Pleckstrin homology domain-containing protein [Cynara cardunculus var. scolymus]|uniref:Pleckstrin homology domain-containing protein n=1 Tax=Cynara cardunculus var. scolymus TaxID=59895 RepID=A0A103YFG7_CYNCS|nr:Pleckstrin homology domain-containing protein [Cynara cardunculus var. scolymus]